MRDGYALPARLLGIGLPLTIAAGTLAALVVLPQLTVAEAAVLAIVLAATDAALGQPVAYLGWFGPRGLASIVFAVLVVEAASRMRARSSTPRRSPWSPRSSCTG